MDEAPGRAQGPPHPAREAARARLGPGLDPGRRQPGRQRLLVRLRAAGAAAGDRSWSTTPGRPAAATGRRRSRPTRRCSARRKSSPPSQLATRRLGPGRRCSRGRPRCPTATRPSRSRRSSTAAARRSSFPPHVPGSGELFGVRWTVVGRAEGRGRRRSRAGAAIRTCWPTRRAARRCRSGQLQVRKYCGLSGEVTPLATLQGGAPLLARVTTNRGAAYFCATTPAPADSSLATNGVVFYVLVQRALAAGAAALGQHAAARRPASRLADDPDTLEARRRRRGGALDRLSVSPRRLPGGRPAAGRQPPGRGGPGAGPGRRPRGRTCSAGSISPASTTRPAASAR